jgi:uncharacterized membrane protein
MCSFVNTVATGSQAGASERRDSRLIPASLLFAGLYIGALAVAEIDSISRPIRVAIALLPVPAFGFFLIEWIRNIRRLDELARRVQLESLAIAFPLSLVLVMALGLIQRVIPLNPLDWSYRHIWPFLIAFYFFGLVLARRRYR